MYISEVTIKGFRVFDNDGITVSFRKGINAVISENNCGKSALIDALRLAFSATKYRKDLYFTFSDFHVDGRGVRSNESTIDIYLEDVQQDFYEFINSEKMGKGEFHIRYFIKPAEGDKEKIGYSIWGDTVEGNTLTSDSFDPINIFYFGALRDAENELKPSRSGKLANLLCSVAYKQEERNSIEEVMRKANEDIEKLPQIGKMQKLINDNLSTLEQEILRQRVKLGLSEARFESIAASLRAWLLPRWILLNDEKISEQLKTVIKSEVWQSSTHSYDGRLYFDSWSIELLEDNSVRETVQALLSQELSTVFEIAQNGLGYNNLLFMATVLGDIKSASKSTLFNLMLVEEPEAHLHPQLQQLVHRFFEDDSNDNVQIIYSSHSPTLVSRIGLEKISILYENGHKIQSLSYCHSKISEDSNSKDKLFLERFLDTTKSQMLFAKGIIFVEGISEAMLIPFFAEMLGLSFDKFAIEVVNIGGVSFKPFADLLCISSEPEKQTIKSVILTDDDRCSDKNKTSEYISKDEDYDTDNIERIMKKICNGQTSSRYTVIKRLCDSSHIQLFGAVKTLEYELSSIESNIAYILSALIDEFPQVGKELFEEVSKAGSLTEKATRIWLFIRSRSDVKGSFIQSLIQRIKNRKVYSINNSKNFIEISTDDKFTIPDYIKYAIIEVTKGTI